MLPESLRPALARAWRPDSAASSLERWLQVRDQEHWGAVPADLDTLVQVFGASWYFTRFIFYSGNNAATRIDDPEPVTSTVPDLEARLLGAMHGRENDIEAALDCLRLSRNEYMLAALVRWLRGQLAPADLEAALTRLAEAVLNVTLELFGLTPEKLGADLAVLGMGRLAGGEMSFGSDLDLIFLLPGDGGAEGAEGARRVRRFLRHIAAAAPLGALYEVDMRLRPHGTAGSLLTSLRSFVEHHSGPREVWERQLMTRCRPVFDPAGLGRAAMDQVTPYLYATRDPAGLRSAILAMRMRVERELGRPRGRFELKRGRGGVMDVDFACHYLQLAHGHRCAALRSCSTREVLRNAAGADLLNAEAENDLRSGYEFLRRVETCLRLFDLKNVSCVPMEAEDCLPLARAMDLDGGSAQRFLDALQEITGAVRARLLELLRGTE